MALRIRRGTDAQRAGVLFESGEVVWTTDLQQLWVGDGTNQGGKPVVGLNVAGYGLTYNNTSHRLEVAGLSADDLTDGVNNKFASAERVQDLVGPMFTSGSHSGITFQYNDNGAGNGVINATVDASAFTDLVGLTSIVNDTEPMLGASLDLNTFSITGTGNIDITGTITAGMDITGDSLNTTGISITDTIQSLLPFSHYDSIAKTASNLVVLGSKSVPNTLYLNSANDAGIIVKSISDGPANASSIRFATSKGSLNSPTALTSNSALGSIGWDGFDGVNYFNAVTIGAIASSVSTGVVEGSLSIGLKKTTSGYSIYTFTANGTFTTPALSVGDGTAGAPSIVFTTDGSVDSGFFHPADGVVCISTDATERVRVDNGGMRVAGFMKVKDFGAGVLPNPPEAGMIVLQNGTFQGYNGSSWVTLG
jgi:hypothetical protein